MSNVLQKSRKSLFSQNCHTIRTKELICMRVCVFSNYNPSNRVEHVEHPSEEKFFEHCTNCAIIPRPLSRDHFCENLTSLLFPSSAGERLQFRSCRFNLFTFHPAIVKCSVETELGLCSIDPPISYVLLEPL